MGALGVLRGVSQNLGSWGDEKVRTECGCRGGRVERGPWSKQGRRMVILEKLVWNEQKSTRNTMAIHSFTHPTNIYCALIMY